MTNMMLPLIPMLGAPNIVRAKTTKNSYVRVAIPTFNGDNELKQLLLNNDVGKIELKSYSNHDKLMDSIIAEENFCDILVAPTRILQRLHYKKCLKYLNFENIRNYTRPDYSLVGRGTAEEWNTMVPFGVTRSLLAIISNKAPPNYQPNMADLYEGRDNLRFGVWTGYSFDVISNISLALGFGYAPKILYRDLLKKFILTNKNKWVMSDEPNKFFDNNQIDATIIYGSEIYDILNNYISPIKAIYCNDNVIINEISAAIPRKSPSAGDAEFVLNVIFNNVVHKQLLEFTFLATQNNKYKSLMDSAYLNNPYIYPRLNNKIKLIESIYVGEENHQWARDFYNETIAIK